MLSFCAFAAQRGASLQTMSKADDLKKAALDYHRLAPPGKIKIVPTKPLSKTRHSFWPSRRAASSRSCARC